MFSLAMGNVQFLMLCTLYLANTDAGKDIYGLKGRTVGFICPLKGESGERLYLYWEMLTDSISKTLSINNRINNQTLEPELYNRLSILGNHNIGEYNLQISDIRDSDEGMYRCIVGIQQEVQTLYLIVPPLSVNIIKLDTSSRLLGTEGQDVTVSCVAVGGKPPPSATLKVDLTILATANQSVTYTFNAISRSYDRKTVTCEAQNDANVNNPQRDAAMLYMYLKPLQPTFSLDPISAEETRPLVVSCTSLGSRPQATFQWYIGQAAITSGITTTPLHNTVDDTYTVTSTLTYTVDRTYNGQTVTCGAYNNVSTSGIVASTTLDVKFAPDITVTNVTYDQTTVTRTLTCIPVGKPTTYTYYRWQHTSTYGELIRQLDGGQILILPNVPVEARYQDSGEYVCTASNGITGRDGKIQQSGSGCVIVNAQPVIASGNKDTEYAELRSDVHLHVYVYSLPRYTTVKWYKTNTLILQTDKYTISESAEIVTDNFHGTKVQLDGYRVTLTIKNLMKSDFNVSYRLEVSNGVGQAVVHTILLELVGAPQTPINFTVLRATESSIDVQWDAGENGGHEQTFYIQYRRIGSKTWVAVKILDTQQTGRQTYTLSELQSGIVFELMMYADNTFKKSIPTGTETIQTTKGNKFSETVNGGVAGSLSAVIVILLIILTVLLVVFRKQGCKTVCCNVKDTGWNAETTCHIPIVCKQTNKHPRILEERGEHNKITEFENAYETLGMKDNLNTYSELSSQHVASFAEYTNVKI